MLIKISGFKVIILLFYLQVFFSGPDSWLRWPGVVGPGI
ncbi:MAG: hypothetical protein OP8BY_0354 [Candidatus Saccharicenans subterraneus]|uniref:Uncharacterized protein n=1 Tax=Candidatus Saccharicenans subterraneus TaxID=2508984 RepID=A0A3E2BL93_9BACT|nr:MAG: hypothetical protein OP8BY_0354 [Candidatus Saccharicenans subterraneum]